MRISGRPLFRAYGGGEEGLSLPVAVKAVTQNPYGSRRPDNFVELRIGLTTRARIVQLDAKQARRLAAALIVAASAVDVSQGKALGYEEGLDRNEK
jgi:hypothetical protein